MKKRWGRTLLVAALFGVLLMAALPSHAAGKHFRIGIVSFRHYYEQNTCPVQNTATEARSTAGQTSQEKFQRGDCVQVRFLVDGGGATTAAGTAPAVEGATFALRFIGEDGKTITTVDAAQIPAPPNTVAQPDLYGALVEIGDDWPSGDVIVEAFPTRAGDTGKGRFKMSVAALGTRLLLEKAAYKPGDELVVRGVTWKDYHRITALTAQMSYPEDPQAKDNVPATGTVTLRRANGSKVTKEFTSGDDGLFSVTFTPAEYGNVAAGPEDGFVKALQITASASYTDPVPIRGTWKTAKGDPDAIAYVKFQNAPAQAEMRADFTSETGWVLPGADYAHQIEYRNMSPRAASGMVITDVLPAGATFVSATPAPSSVSGRTLKWNIGSLTAGSDWSGARRIIVHARAATEAQDRTIVWQDLSSTATLTQSGGVAQRSTTLGPKVTTLDTARYGNRPFPVVLVDYQDAEHSATRPGWYFDQVINEDLKPSTLVTLYEEMSFGQLRPHGTVASVNATDATFDAAPSYKWATPSPKGVCLGASLIVPNPTSDVSEYKPTGTRVEDGWYRLPGTQAYYGGDEASYGETVLAVGGLPRLGIDGACGPTGKIAYDAASISDPDVDYNTYDTDRNGLVDFFMVVSRGLGGNGDSQIRGGYDAVWPHSSSLESYFIDPNGQLGYVSRDQLRDKNERPLWWTSADARKNNDLSKLTTQNKGDDLKAFVRVGPYNANPEVSSTSVIAHEYGHSLGLPDYYSSGSRRTVGYWDLMSTDYSQFMSVFSRQDLGWIVPKVLSSGKITTTLRESKGDTHRIEWRDSSGKPYVLSGDDVHNADAYYVPLPRKTLITSAPSGKRVWYSTAGNDFGCPGKTLDLRLPTVASASEGDTLTLTFKSLYEIEWDYDYGFVMVSTDDGNSFTALESETGSTTPVAYNPNNNGCQTQNGNGITGTSSVHSFPENLTNRSPAGDPGTGVPEIDGIFTPYPEPAVFEEKFDLSEFAGQPIVLRFAYSTDAGLAKKGWFIDDVKIQNETKNQTLFNDNVETKRVEWDANGWTPLAAGPGSADHGYYVELRDRIGFDFDGRGQGDRVPIDWIPGVSLWYTDELGGYGNTGESTDDPPNQTTIDARPQKGSTGPRLQDAAFYPIPGIDTYTDTSWTDNYQDPESEDHNWKLAFGCFSMKVLDVDGLGAAGATAQVSLTANDKKCLKVAGATTVLGERKARPATKRGGTLPATGAEAGWAGLALVLAAGALGFRARRNA